MFFDFNQFKSVKTECVSTTPRSHFCLNIQYSKCLAILVPADTSVWSCKPMIRLYFLFITAAVTQTWWGFQSLSKITTVSAACKLRPRPPALVLSRKTKYCEPCSLNCFKSNARSSDFVVPVTKRVIMKEKGQSICAITLIKKAMNHHIEMP